MSSGSVRDLWAGEDLGTFDTFKFNITGNGASRTFRVYLNESLPWNVGL